MQFILVSNKGRQTISTFKSYRDALRGKKTIENMTNKTYQILPFVGVKKRPSNDRKNGA